MSAASHPAPESAPRRPAVLLDASAIAQLLASRRCSVCGDPKPAGDAVCRTDFLALPLSMRRLPVPTDPAFPDALRRCLQHLADQPHRALRILPDGTRWPHRTPDDLTGAGFRFIALAQCAAPRCAAPIAWYWTPERRRLAIDAAYLQPCLPHRTTCLDPDFLARRRQQLDALRTSAVKKRRKL